MTIMKIIRITERRLARMKSLWSASVQHMLYIWNDWNTSETAGCRQNWKRDSWKAENRNSHSILCSTKTKYSIILLFHRISHEWWRRDAILGAIIYNIQLHNYYTIARPTWIAYIYVFLYVWLLATVLLITS